MISIYWCNASAKLVYFDSRKIAENVRCPKITGVYRGVIWLHWFLNNWKLFDSVDFDDRHVFPKYWICTLIILLEFNHLKYPEKADWRKHGTFILTSYKYPNKTSVDMPCEQLIPEKYKWEVKKDFTSERHIIICVHLRNLIFICIDGSRTFSIYQLGGRVSVSLSARTPPCANMSLVRNEQQVRVTYGYHILCEESKEWEYNDMFWGSRMIQDLTLGQRSAVN